MVHSPQLPTMQSDYGSVFLKSTESFRRRLYAFYSKYNVEKLAHLDDTVEPWSQREKQLNAVLVVFVKSWIIITREFVVV
jgi:hypothetical protein